MTDSQLTQCPHCKASFKVSEEQLNAANGRVRCGACLNIFDAIAYQISSSLKTETTPPAEQRVKSVIDDDFSFELDDAVDLENELLDSDKPELNSPEDDTVFADDPEEDKLEQGYSGSTKLNDEFSSSFLELDSSEKDSFKTHFLNDESPEIVDTETIDESWTSSILDDLEEPTKDKIEPDFNIDEKIDEPELTDFSLQQTDTFSETSSPHFEQKDLNALKFQYEQDTTPKKKWLIATTLLLVNLALLALLLAQASWFHYEKLVKYPKVAEVYELVCAQLGCELPRTI